MFSDPITLIENTTTLSAPAIGRGPLESVYRYEDPTSGDVYAIRVGHKFGPRRNRTYARIEREKYVSSVSVPANSELASWSSTLTVDWPLAGVTDNQVKFTVLALTGWLTSVANGGNILRMIGGET